MKKFTPELLIWLVPITMLFIGLGDLPYGYYTLLRILVCASTAYLAWQHYNYCAELTWWTLLLGFIAVLFNPIIPIHLEREIWAPIDVISAAVLIVHMIKSQKILERK